MVAIGNIGRLGDSPNVWPSHMRHILHPLLMVTNVIGASVRHADRRVMVGKVVYFVFANALLLVAPVVCVYDIAHVRIVCGANVAAINLLRIVSWTSGVLLKTDR
jgi:hypothetical protein